MSNWELGSKPFHDGTRDVTINFINDDAIGAVTGTLFLLGVPFSVTGNWAASGSVPGRNHSAFAVWGYNDGGATEYIAAAGIMIGTGDAPTSIDMNLFRVDTGKGRQFVWDGQLLPVTQ